MSPSVASAYVFIIGFVVGTELVFSDGSYEVFKDDRLNGCANFVMVWKGCNFYGS